MCTVRGRVCPEHKVRETGYTVLNEIDDEEETINFVQFQNCPASAGTYYTRKIKKYFINNQNLSKLKY